MENVMDQLRQQIAYNEQINGSKDAAKSVQNPEVKRRGRPKKAPQAGK